jgi:hypothetical protein
MLRNRFNRQYCPVRRTTPPAGRTGRTGLQESPCLQTCPAGRGGRNKRRKGKNIMSKLVTQSSLKTYATCPRKYDYRINKELVKDEAVETLEAGKDIHEVLRKIHTGKKFNFSAISDPAQRAMISKYCKIYNIEIYNCSYDGRKILDVEVEFRTRIYHPATGRPSQNYRQGGKVDLLVEEPYTDLPDRQAGNPEPGLGIVDHKTTSKLDGEYIDRITHDQQLYSYAVALELDRKIPVRTLYLNVLCKPTIRLKQNETPDEYYERCLEWLTPDKFYRHTVTLDRDFMLEVKVDMWNKVQLLHESVKYELWPRNTESCMHWGRICPYFELCMKNQQHLVGEVYVHKRAHSELKKEESYIFTFGSNTPNGNHFIELTGTYEEALQKMHRLYGARWAFQYDSREAAGVQQFDLKELTP